MDLSSYDLQQDNKKLAIIISIVGVLSLVITVFIIGLSYFSFSFFGFIIFVLCVYIYSSLNRYCGKCGLRMTKDYSNGILCENHYCISCKRKVKIYFRNKR